MRKATARLVHGRSVRWAQLENDGSVGCGYHVPMNTHSVSKFVTAIATVKLLRSLGVSTKTPIAGYLPDHWNPGTNVGNITFHHLLRHESGLGGSINMGGNFSSGSGNFALLRVMFAVPTGTLETSFRAPPGFSVDNLWDYASTMAYSNYVNDNIFAAASIAPRQFAPDDIAAKAYGNPPRAPGVRLPDVIEDAGSSGWHLSIGELTRLLSEFRRGGSMMSPSRAEQLLTNLYGLDGADDTNAGPVYRKNGRYNDGGVNTMDMAIYLLTKGVELAIYVNSGPGSGPTRPRTWRRSRRSFAIVSN